MKNRTILLSLPRSFGTAEVAVVTPDEGRDYVSIDNVAHSGVSAAGRVPVKAEELDDVIRALGEARRLLCGHPKHDPKSKDPVLGGTK